VNHDSEATMVLDGACLDPQEYGLLAGFGFALLFGVFGVFRCDGLWFKAVGDIQMSF